MLPLPLLLHMHGLPCTSCRAWASLWLLPLTSPLSSGLRTHSLCNLHGCRCRQHRGCGIGRWCVGACRSQCHRRTNLQLGSR